MDKQLVKRLVKGEYKRSPEMDGDACPGEKVNMFSVEGDECICKIWNSSNNSPFNKKEACEEILAKLLEDEDTTEGHFVLDFNEIWFEICGKK